MAKILWGRFLAVTSLIVGSGYALLATTTPTEEEFYNKLSPELKRKVDEIRAQRRGQGEVQSALAAADDEGKVVWGDELKRAAARDSSK